MINSKTIAALQERDKQIKKLEILAVQKGVDLNKVKEQAKTTVYDYHTLLLNAIS